MTGFDYAILAIIGVSLLLGIMRGFVKELLSLAGWIVAFVVARTYAIEIIHLLPKDIPTAALKTLAAFLSLFLATLLMFSLFKIVITKIVKKIGLGWLDVMLGGFFGFSRGLIVVSVLVLLAGMTNIPKDPTWKNAMFSAPLEALVRSALPLLPEKISQYVKYDE